MATATATTSLRRSEMNDIAIRIESLGKRYRYGAAQSVSSNLRADLTDWARGVFRLRKDLKPETVDQKAETGSSGTQVSGFSPQVSSLSHQASSLKSKVFPIGFSLFSTVFSLSAAVKPERINDLVPQHYAG